MHREEDMDRDEYGTGFKDMMEEEKWKKEVGIDMNDEGEERVKENGDERMNRVDLQRRKQEGRRKWEDLEKGDME